MSALVLAGFATTTTLQSGAACFSSELACPLQMATFLPITSLALHPQGRARKPPTITATSTSLHASSTSTVATMPLTRAVRRVDEPHRDAAQRGLRGGDVQQVQDDLLVGAEHSAAAHLVGERVADLAGRARDKDALGSHREGRERCRKDGHPTPFLCDAGRRLRCLDLEEIKTSPKKIAGCARRLRRVGFEHAASGKDDALRLSPPVLDARGTRRCATPRRWRERAAARAPLPRAAPGSCRGVPRAEGSAADRKPTDQVGALSRLFARETLAGGRCRLLKRPRRRPVPALYVLVAHTRRVDDEPRANANLLTDWAQPNGWFLRNRFCHPCTDRGAAGFFFFP